MALKLSKNKAYFWTGFGQFSCARVVREKLIPRKHISHKEPHEKWGNHNANNKYYP